MWVETATEGGRRFMATAAAVSLGSSSNSNLLKLFHDESAARAAAVHSVSCCRSYSSWKTRLKGIHHMRTRYLPDHSTTNHHVPHPILLTCPLHSNRGCGKRQTHINWSIVMQVLALCRWTLGSERHRYAVA